MRVYQVKGQEVMGVKAASQSGWRSDQKELFLPKSPWLEDRYK